MKAASCWALDITTREAGATLAGKQAAETKSEK